jgi:hypothetical protein
MQLLVADDRQILTRDALLSRLASVCLQFATAVVASFASALLLSALSLAAGFALSPWPLIVALTGGGVLFSSAASRELGRAQRPVAMILAASWLLSLGAAFALSWLVYDVSHDGQNYHLEGVLSLARGWNPFRTWILPNAEPGVDVESVTHYPKAAWIIAAQMYQLTHRIEMAKAYNPLLAMAACGFCLAAALRLFPRRPGTALIVALLAAANPIAVVQTFSFYVDGPLACVLTSLFAAILLMRERRDWLTHLAIASSIVLAVNLKFTGLVFALVIAATLIPLCIRPKTLPSLVTAAAAFAVALLLVGFQPYVTNTIAHRDPFYPVSSGSVLAGQVDPAFMQRDRISKLLLSTFSRGANQMDGTPKLKLPFTVGIDELRAYSKIDTRFAGLGPLFGGCILLSIFVFVAALRSNRRRALGYAAVASVTVLSALAISEAWWARFVPQLWLLPVFGTALALGADMPRRLRTQGALLAALLFVNVSVVAAANGASVFRRVSVLRNQLHELRAASFAAPLEVRLTGVCRSLGVRLAEAEVKFVRTDAVRCTRPVELAESCNHVMACQTETPLPPVADAKQSRPASETASSK